MLKIKIPYRIEKFDFFLVILLAALSTLGVLLIGSANPAYRLRQAAGAGMGMAVMVCMSLMDYKRLVRLDWLTYFCGVGLLLTVNAAGAISGGAARWIEIGPVRFQPSELEKILFILFLVTRPDQQILDDYQYRRIMAWLSPGEWAQDSYQQRNSMMAIGSGGLFGKGLETQTVLSVKNGNFLPEPHTDFIMSVAGEELGFAGSVLILTLLLLIVFECIRIGTKAKDMTGKLICVGMGLVLNVGLQRGGREQAEGR